MAESKVIYKQFVKLLRQFVSFKDYKDEKWIFLCKLNRKWLRVYITLYNEKFYVQAGRDISWTLPDDLSDRVDENLKGLCACLQDWLSKVRKDAIAAQSELMSKLPLSMRTGCIHRRNVNLLIPEWHDFAKDLKSKDFKRMVDICEKFDQEKPQPDFTLAQYWEYCRIAYEANPKTFKESYHKFESGLSGKEYYKKYADGRCGRLHEIDETCPKAFSEWYDNPGFSGDHPWEIYRGGSSTHINLFVSKDKDKKAFFVGLEAFSSTRMLETCRIALALDSAGLPFELRHKKSYLKRLLQEDWVGIVPEDSYIKYAWHQFPQEWNVADCIHLSWLYEDRENKVALKRKLAKFISWMPENLSCHLNPSRKS